MHFAPLITTCKLTTYPSFCAPLWAIYQFTLLNMYKYLPVTSFCSPFLACAWGRPPSLAPLLRHCTWLTPPLLHKRCTALLLHFKVNGVNRLKLNPSKPEFLLAHHAPSGSPST